MSQATRVAFVTGAGAGIGRAIAQALAQADHAVVAGDVNLSAAEETAATIRATGAEAVASLVDVTNVDSIDSAFNEVDKRWGRLDVLVNNAGIARVAHLLDMSIDDFRAVFDVNVMGTFLCTQRAATLMRKNRWGRIVNTASISAFRASAGRAAYGPSKAAVVSLTKQTAIEMSRDGITANAVAPGPIETEFTLKHHPDAMRRAYERSVPLGRYGLPEEIAAAVCFLASEKAGYINGCVLDVDGGFLAAGVPD
ncbi:NAD(P)-dependent dehydrogenase, short-chain alcohol dehydrogenase family [Variovorax sp. CF079]|uniref:SDR family NAD(P)-dependent oxidoreductase n=1 Tax=Variovorax sp. CF079 TaxID=1882774 RepID=UPI00088648AA|nr:3-oxoacyl-ACP reductase family protein [Variovorax sp. CF079]SDE96489.1 NAD(P)-dependent dehydrogenase, short-chain alcohol dehydrogenase family [Variovorax sp. CF079]